VQCERTPVATSACTFGVTRDTTLAALSILLGIDGYNGTTPRTLDQRVALAINSIVSAKPATTFGASLPSFPVTLARRYCTML
jgi:hypothetical protein